MKSHDETNVLIYRPGRRQSKVRRHYERWRFQQVPPIPLRCDEPSCQFHVAPLVWNGKPFKLLLDHTNGVNGDNRPENLRLLCPICAHQLPTHGGGNKGRVERSTGGFAQIAPDGKRHYTLPAESGAYAINGPEKSCT